MGGTDQAFFYAARHFGIWDVILILSELPDYSWLARRNVLAARAEKKRLQEYAYDLLWLEAKRHYRDLPQPSLIAAGKPIKDKRTALEIITDTIKKLRKGGR